MQSSRSVCKKQYTIVQVSLTDGYNCVLQQCNVISAYSDKLK